MTIYIGIRGWLECPHSKVNEVKSIISSFIDKSEQYGLTAAGAETYNKGWHIPDSHINWTYYMFYGADIRINCVDYIKDQIKLIAHQVFEQDGDCIDYPVGIFDLEDETKTVFYTWEISNGTFEETNSSR